MLRCRSPFRGKGDFHLADTHRLSKSDGLEYKGGMTMAEFLKGRVVLFAFEQKNFTLVSILQQLVGMPLVAKQMQVFRLIQIIDVLEALSVSEILPLVPIRSS